MADIEDKESGRRLRERKHRIYSYEDDYELLDTYRGFVVEEKLISEDFDENKFGFVTEMCGKDLTFEYIQRNGFEKPIVIKEMKGLGMKIPAKDFSVNDVKQCVGSRRVLDVMDVHSQRDFNMTMKEWCAYYENPERTRLLNVISLEFSHTKLEQYVDSPHIVKQVDWIDWVWPKHLKQSQTEGTNAIEDMKYPKVQKYCLMSVKGCYTDFHIDFGGTSVWYHILKGRKVFWLIRPTETNIQLYENWVLSGKQSDVFFGDQVKECARVELEAGHTFFIPTGWIHAVFTPEDSLVFGGNFLHSFSIELQLRVAQVEDNTKVPAKFRYPFYTEVLWYVLARYVFCLMNDNHLKCNEDGVTVNRDNETNDTKPPVPPNNKPTVYLTPFELSGLKAIIQRLETLPQNKKSVPELVLSAEKLINNAKILIDEHKKDHESAELWVTGRPVLFWSKKATHFSSITSQLRSIKGPTYVKHMRNKETPSVTPAVRPESPPTRPISSNQYSVSSGSTLSHDLIPSSFAGLIAQTGVNHFQPFNPLSVPSMMNPIRSPITAVPQMPLSFMPSALPPPPPLISNPNMNSTINSFQSPIHANSSQTLYQSLPQKDLLSEQMNVQNNHNSNSNPMDKKPLNPVINDSNNLNHNYVQNTNQTNFANYFINSSPLKRSSPPLMTAMETQTQTQSCRLFPSALPPSGFHSTGIQSEPFVNKMVNSSTQSSFPTNQKLLVSTGAGTTSKSNSNDSSRRRRTRCKKCDSCLRADCGECHFCKDMKKFGGPGRMKQSCIARQCLAPVLPHTACCMICGRDGWEKLVDPSINDETASSLMECSQCWEIVHPFCLNEKFPQFVSSEANLNEELPNSWECPRCVKTGGKHNKYSKSKSNMSTNTCPSMKNSGESDAPPEKKCRMSDEDSPPSSDEEDNEIQRQSHKSFNSYRKEDETEDTDTSSSSSHTDGNYSSNSYQSKPYPMMATSSSAHVRSCARFPLLSQGIKQLNSNSNTVLNKNTFSPINTNNNNKPEVKGLAALMVHKKKPNESSRERLFKSIKGLKSIRFAANATTHPKKSHKTATTSTSSTTTSSNSNSSVSSPSFTQNTESLSPSPLTSVSSTMTENNFNSINGKNELNFKSIEMKNELHDESTDDEVDGQGGQQSAQQSNDSKQSTDLIPKRELIKPKYVVRPAPLDCDVSESEETDESSDESEDESNDKNNNKNNKKIKKERNKAKLKYFRKFRAKLADNLALERAVILPVLNWLSKTDLIACMSVCKLWNGFTIEPKLWPIVDLSHKKITSVILIGIVRRQPKHLNLSWTNITRRQLFWLISRLPYLQSLSLAGCHSSVVSALITCNCPRMESLDISWSEGVNDDFIGDILSAPNDSRPGLMETKTRLRFLAEFRIGGSNISDKSIRLMTQNLPFVRRIDISNCNRVTDMGIAVLATAKVKTLTHLNLSACTNISDMSLDSLRRCPTIELLDVRECPQVTRNACHLFVSQYPPSTKLICN